MELSLLPADVVSKLRSGVAIVSVAHCMEELVLNALDAGATCVAVRLNMPYYKVQVVDNGHGMPRDQLENCGERYCTSKCRSLSDLEHPKFYGYRGEAISSIVEMSGIVQIESRSSTCSSSWCKVFARGKLREIAPSTTNRPSVGTTVTVLDFMYNFPVRRGCLSEAIDFEFCLQHLEGIALSHPEVSFTLRNDVTGEKHFQTHKTNSVCDIFAQLFGAQRAATLKHAIIKKKHLIVEAYIGLEGHTTKQLQFVYINKRLLRKTRIHKLFHNVIKKYVLGAHTKSAPLCGSPSKPRNKQPVFVIFIDCTSRTFDITYEPQKTFVEFTDWDKVTKMFEQLLNDFLHKHGIICHNFVINGELAFSQKTSPECEPAVRTDLNNIEDVRNALVSMKACRKGPHTAAEKSGRLENITTSSSSEKDLEHPAIPLVHSSNIKADICQSRDVGPHHPKAVIALPPYFSAVSNTRPLLCMPENDTPFKFGKRIAFAKQSHSRSAHPEQTCAGVKQCSVPEDCPTRRRRLAHHHQNNPKRKTCAESSQQTDVGHEVTHKETNCYERERLLAPEPTSHTENVKDIAVCMEKKRQPAAIHSHSSDELCSSKLHCKCPCTATQHKSYPKKMDTPQQRHVVHKPSHNETNCREKFTSFLPEPASHNANANGASVANAENPRQVALKHSHCTEGTRDIHVHHKDNSTEISNFQNASDSLLSDFLDEVHDHNHAFTQTHVHSVKPTPLATKLHRRMKAFLPTNKCTSATSAFFYPSDSPPFEAVAHPYTTSESFIKTADFRCICVQAQQLCPVHGTEIIPSKAPKFDQHSLQLDEENALDEPIRSACQMQKFMPETTLSQPFACSGNLECGFTQSQINETTTAPVQGTQPFTLQEEMACDPAALEMTETASVSGSPIEIDGISSSEEFTPVKISEDKCTADAQGTPPGIYHSSSQDGPAPAATSSSFSLTQVKFIQSNNRHMTKSSVTHSLFLGSMQKNSPQCKMFTQASCVTEKTSPCVENDNSWNIETAENELGGLTQPSPTDSQQLGKCKESTAVNAEALKKQLPIHKEGSATIPGDQSRANINGQSRTDDHISTVEMYPGNWASCIDPTSGKKVFVNMASGNSSFTLPSLCLEQEDPAPIEALDTAKLRNVSLASAPFVQKFQPRPQDERPQFGCLPDAEQADVANMVRAWNNPALSCTTTDQDIADGGLFSKGSRPLYRITESYKFRKEMLNYVQVIGQVDAKFIACLMPLSQNRVVQEESLIVLFDQHAAHERVRLEWLLENQYEARGQARCVRSSALSSELTIALEPDSLRRAAMCEKEMRKLGIQYIVRNDGVSFKRLPVCLLEKDESEQRAGRPSTLSFRLKVQAEVWLDTTYREKQTEPVITYIVATSVFIFLAFLMALNTLPSADSLLAFLLAVRNMEAQMFSQKEPKQQIFLEFLRDHTEMLLGTRHSAITLPKFLMDVLSSQACHGAIRFGSALEKSECHNILKALSKCMLPFQCAHGRPSLMPIVDLRFLPSEKECRKPNLAALLSRLHSNVNSPKK